MADPRDESIARNVAPFGSKAGIPKSTFVDQIFRPTYVFPSISHFIDREADRIAFPDHSLRNKVKHDWFLSQASNSLGNACHQRKNADAQASVDRAVAMRDSLALALAACEAGILETTRQLGLPEPPFARQPESTANGTRHVRKPKHPGE